jgi:hypothetical protein
MSSSGKIEGERHSKKVREKRNEMIYTMFKI